MSRVWSIRSDLSEFLFVYIVERCPDGATQVLIFRRGVSSTSSMSMGPLGAWLLLHLALLAHAATPSDGGQKAKGEEESGRGQGERKEAHEEGSACEGGQSQNNKRDEPRPRRQTNWRHQNKADRMEPLAKDHT